MNIYKVQKLKKLRHFIQCRYIYYNYRLDDFPLTCVNYKTQKYKEERYAIWEKNNFFNPSNDSEKTFSMILPPPNITGTLHLGHVMTATIQDTLARWYRMKNIPVLWIPGLDHAGIATQAVIERHLAKTKNIKRSDMSKEEFLSLIHDWKEEKGNVIRNQLKNLGTTLDWSKEYFTMSNEHNIAVKKAIVHLNNKGLLYRDKKMINYSPTLGSAISDIEVEYKECTEKTNFIIPGYNRKIAFGQIFEIAFNVHESDEQIMVHTTRPETIFGDVAIAVHPNDSRYSKFVGRYVTNPLTNKLMPILSDESVKMDFGSGAVKITPAHSNFDYEIAKKYNLEIINVVNEKGCMTAVAGEYQGLPKYIARHKVLEYLAQNKLLINTKDHQTSIPFCSRTGDVIEFFLREQWYLNCKTMANKAIDAVKNDRLKLTPKSQENVWYEWLKNSRDWCLSRQIWWGHQIPAYKCTFSSGESKWFIGNNEKEVRDMVSQQFGEILSVEQEKDVLDTWFSSALLPFTAMGWPNDTKELKHFYPLSLMETGHDIIFYWVARMVMLGLELTGKLPFNEVLFHGVLCNGTTKKMSKSSGNVILPENVIDGISYQDLNKQAKKNYDDGILSEENLKQTLLVNKELYPKGIPACGVDALRYSMVSFDISAQLVQFSDVICRENNYFCNKIWQASRYAILMTKDYQITIPKELTLIDKWILSRLSQMISSVNSNLEEKMFWNVTSAIRLFVYHEFCDYYIEATKLGFQTENPEIVEAHCYTLAHCLEVCLRTLSPIMPYFVDELYSRLSEKLSLFSKYDSVAQASYPQSEEFEKYRDIDLENRMDTVLKVIKTIRELVGTMKKSEIQIHVITDDEEIKEFLQINSNMINGVTRIPNVNIVSSDYVKGDNSLCVSVEPSCTVLITLKDAVTLEQLQQTIQRRELKQQKEIAKMK